LNQIPEAFFDYVCQATFFPI